MEKVRRVQIDSNVVVVNFDDDITTLIYTHGDCNHVNDQGIEQIFDTGTTYHCVPKKELFTTYKARDFGHIMMGNKIFQIVGIGDIVVETSISYTLTLKDVRHIPNLRMNLLVVNVLNKERCKSKEKNE